MTETLDRETWGLIVILFAIALLILSCVVGLIGDLWAARHTKPQLPLYDWAKDDGYLDELARDAEGCVTAVFPVSWRYR